MHKKSQEINYSVSDMNTTIQIKLETNNISYKKEELIKESENAFINYSNLKAQGNDPKIAFLYASNEAVEKLTKKT